MTQSSSQKNVYGLTFTPFLVIYILYIELLWYYYIVFKYIGSVEILCWSTSPLRILPTKTKRDVREGGGPIGGGRPPHVLSCLFPLCDDRRLLG